MGFNSFWRRFLYGLRPEAVWSCPRRSWPQWPGRRYVVLDDANFRIRGMVLDAPDKRPRRDGSRGGGLNTWGGVLNCLAADYEAMFAAGVEVVVVIIDGRSLLAKYLTQLHRAEDAKRQRRDHLAEALEAQRRDHELDLELWGEKPQQPQQQVPRPPGDNLYPRAQCWPEAPANFETDPEFLAAEWFRPDMLVQCNWDGVYYGGAGAPKFKFTQFVSDFLLKRMALPVGARLIVDCGILLGHPRATRPLQTRWAAHGYESDVSVEFMCGDLVGATWNGCRLEQIEEAGGASRVVEPVPCQDAYGTSSEADDRIIHWTYAFRDQIDLVVCSGDQDTLLALMMTTRTRYEAFGMGQMHKIWWRRANRPNGDDDFVDIDDLSWTLRFYLGHLGRHTGPAEQIPDPVVAFSALALLRDSDYTYTGTDTARGESNFAGVSPVKLATLLLEKPQLFEGLFVGTPRVLSSDGPMGEIHLERPVQVLISRLKFRKLVTELYYLGARGQPRLNKVTGKPQCNPDGTVKLFAGRRYEMPSVEDMDATCARLAWVLDKFLNAGRPRCGGPANETEQTPDTYESLHGYQSNGQPCHRVNNKRDYFGVRRQQRK
jgi:hypothetical protein